MSLPERIDLDIQWALANDAEQQSLHRALNEELIHASVDAVLNTHHQGDAEMTTRFVDSAKSQQLNLAYRGQDKPTNVLSFPSELPDFVASPLLGDLIICHAVVTQEALQQTKSLAAHYQHLIIHGTLHLLGFDHINEADANIMEAHEIAILAQLGIDDPYQVD